MSADLLTGQIDAAVTEMLAKAKLSDNVKDFTAAVLAAVKWHDSKRGLPGGSGMGGALGSEE